MFVSGVQFQVLETGIFVDIFVRHRFTYYLTLMNDDFEEL